MNINSDSDIGSRWLKAFMILGLFAIIAVCTLIIPARAYAASEESDSSGELHAFYPSNAVFTEQMKTYIDSLDSISFAWSRIDAESPEIINTVKGLNGNNSFYYPADYLKSVEYAKNAGKSIQLNIYMDRSDCTELLPYADKRVLMTKAIVNTLQTDITSGNSIFYDGVVIDFEGLRDTDTEGTQLLYEGKPISTYFIQFLSELEVSLAPLDKKLYVAVNPGLYYDGYDYSNIVSIADRMIIMAHDYEPTGKLPKNQVQQYTGYDALEPINSMAPIQLIRNALNEITGEVSGSSDLSKIWLQITFDSAQWRYEVTSAAAWETLDGTALSREGRLTPLYSSIKARVDNTDGKGSSIAYGYNNELQSPYLQYFNSSDYSWNIILYEDSNSITAKIELAKVYGLGGISLWSLANVPDYNDANGINYHLNGWSTILDQMKNYTVMPKGSSEKITFQDALVKQAIQDKLGKTSVSRYDLQNIYRLKLPQGVKSLSDLKNLTNLEYLDAQQLGISNISAINSLKNLRVLYLQRNQITEINALKKLSKLQVLSLNGNQLVSVSALSSLTKLQKLYLRENRIVSITPLAKLTKLKILEMGVNNISQIDALKNLTGLSLLSLDNNKVTDVQALKALTGLEELYLQRNSIVSISSLSSLKKLKLLSLNGNRISDLKPLSKLTLLEKLYLKENKITSVAALMNQMNLKELYLSGNKITDYSPVKKIYQKYGFLCDFALQ